MKDRIYDLENRLITFSVCMISIAEKIPKSFAGNALASQLSRSCTAPALNYGEAQSAESINDFIHKMKVSLKELRETSVCLKMLYKLCWVDEESFTQSSKECGELIAIFMKSIQTAERNKSLK